MKTLLLSLILALFFATSTTAATLKKGKAVCLSKDFLDQAITASIQKDKLGWNYLFKKGYCIITAQDFTVSVLEISFGVRKIRVYVNGDAAVVWTFKENITP